MRRHPPLRDAIAASGPVNLLSRRLPRGLAIAIVYLAAIQIAVREWLGAPARVRASHPRRVTTDHPIRGEGGEVVAPVGYEIRIKGRLSDSVTGAFEDFTAAVKPAETVMRGEIRDQSELHGLLDRIQSLGLELIEVRRLPEED